MSVFRLSEVTKEMVRDLISAGCYLREYTANGEKWLFVLRPVQAHKNDD